MPPPRKPITFLLAYTYSYHSSSNVSPVKDAPQVSSDSRPWQYGATPSYMDRQNSAVNGLAMHGVGNPNGYTTSAVEIDGYSNIGRNGEGSSHDQGTTVHSVDPATGERLGRRISRVDVPGTGGLRDPRV